MKIDPEVIAILQKATIDRYNLILNGTLDRKLYVKCNEAIEAIGGKWNRKAKAHVFAEDPKTIISKLLDEEEVETDKDRGFFPTPSHVVEQMIELADLQPIHSVLEPSAGNGAIARPAKAITSNVDVVELHDASRTRLETEGFSVVGSDFLKVKPTKLYDRILMNPPSAKALKLIMSAMP